MQAARRFDFAAERFELFGAASCRRYVVSFGREPSAVARPMPDVAPVISACFS